MPRIHRKKGDFIPPSTVNKPLVEKSPEVFSPFSSLLQRVEQQELKERLDHLLETIDLRGEELKRRMTQANLLAYQRIIGEFLKVINQEYLKTRETMSRGRDGRLRILKTIHRISTEMEELKQLILQREFSHIQVMERLDVIRGLLLDIYL